MPKSRRDKKVSLTKTSKHGMDWKKKMVTEIRDAAEKHDTVYVFRVVGMRGNGLRELRKSFRKSRIFLGKNKVMALALGKDPQGEVRPNIHHISARLQGECGLLFTSEESDKVESFFENFVEKDYARSGTIATETVTLEEGPLTQFAHSMEPHLRSLGLPTSLKRGVITLIKEYNVCQKGQTLNPEQAKILKQLAIPMSEFRILPDSVWSQPDSFKVLAVDDEESEVVLSGDEENEVVLLSEDEVEMVDDDDEDDDE